MKNFEIAAIVEAYEKLKASDEKGPVLSAPVAWKRRLNLKKLLDAKTVIDEALSEIERGYADDEHSIEENGQRRVKREYLNEFALKRIEILNQDTDVELKKISIDDLGDVSLSERDMDTLAFMIEE